MKQAAQAFVEQALGPLGDSINDTLRSRMHDLLFEALADDPARGSAGKAIRQHQPRVPQ